MDPKTNKLINIYGIIIWIIMFPIITPIHTLFKYPLTILGFLYPIIILLINNYLIGNELTSKEEDYSESTRIAHKNKAVQISSATFAIAVASKEIFEKKVYRDILIYISYTLLFGVGILIPSYFISNRKDKSEIDYFNELLTRLRNVSLSYSIGFMTIIFFIIISRIYTLNKYSLNIYK